MITAIVVGYNLYNKKHRSIFESPVLPVSADELFNQYERNEEESNKKYLDKAVEVTGPVAMVFENKDGKSVIVLKDKDDFFGVSCTLERLGNEKIQIGSTITIRGFCTGYLSDVVLNRAEIIKQ